MTGRDREAIRVPGELRNKPERPIIEMIQQHNTCVRFLIPGPHESLRRGCVLQWR
jgi:hypothetical protein